MNWDQVEGAWKTIKGRVREQWGKITDDDIETIAGKKDRFVGAIQQRYGYEKEKAELEVANFLQSLKAKSSFESEKL